MVGKEFETFGAIDMHGNSFAGTVGARSIGHRIGSDTQND